MSPTLSVRDNRPAIEVRDRNLWASDPRTAHFYDDLPQTVIDQLYAQTAEDFWSEIAPAIAREHGYSGKVWSAGRSSGWLVLDDGLSWPDYAITDGRGIFHSHNAATGQPFYIPPADDTADDDTREEYAEMIAQRDRFLRFADAIEEGMRAAEASFVERLSEELAELHAAREAAIVRGEN